MRQINLPVDVDQSGFCENPLNVQREMHRNHIPMAKMMKAAVVRELGRPLTIEEWPIPVPGQGEVLVKIMATGVCHTDLHAAEGDWPVKPTAPFIPGHEGAGIVAAVGPGVTHVREGDAVGALPGCMTHAAIANIAALVGKRCARANMTAAIA